jgi:hypothetical protein
LEGVGHSAEPADDIRAIVSPVFKHSTDLIRPEELESAFDPLNRTPTKETCRHLAEDRAASGEDLRQPLAWTLTGGKA